MRLSRIKHIFLLVGVFTGLFLASCSVEKNTSATRNFHNLASHYNIYFNAIESYKAGIIKAEESVQDDFRDVLPIHYYAYENIQQNVSPQMKRAIDKSTKVITFHSIKAKPKMKDGRQSEKDKAFYDKSEYNKWVDDCYLLVGKCYLHQGEFFTAVETFKHVISNFQTEDSYFPALAWLVKAYNEIGEFDQSEEILVQVKDLEEYPEKYHEDLYTAYADFYIKQEDWVEAAKYLELALKSSPKKNDRVRYTFILAQVYAEAGMGDASITNYKKVIRMNPPYVMAFNSKVNMAGAFRSGESDSDEIKKLLFKMLKDAKNDEFQDQIYYALGNLYMAEGDREQAIEYYHLSVIKSVQNNYQKGESCLTLAEIYYNDPKYTLSAAYYDTAVRMLDPEYPNYKNLEIRSRSLNGLVYNLHTYEFQDSVQRLAQISESDLNKLIDNIISELKKEEEAERLRQQEAMQDLQFNRADVLANDGSYNQNTQAGGKWYFYNLNAKSFGQPEFRMKWGDRKLEDNWRRSNKQSLTELLGEDGAEQDSVGEGEGGQILDNKSREFYLKDIPFSDSMMVISEEKLQEGLYNMGMIYRDDLLDYNKAIESLELLINRKKGEYTMAAYYYLHDLYNNIQQPERANYYKGLLSELYPDSHMAKLLTNPNYIEELEAERKKVENYYVSIYNNFQNSNYSEVIRLADAGREVYGEEEEMIMQVDYMRALSVGALEGKESLKLQLDSILAWYPGTEIATEAQDIVDYMYVAFPVIKEAQQVQEAVALYSYDSTATHKFGLAIKTSENLNLVNFNLLNYNLDNFIEYDLRIEIMELGVDYNLLVVGDFTDMEGLTRYADQARDRITDIMGELSSDLYEIVLISEDNIDKLIDVKEFTPYLLFYKQNYPQ